MWRRLRARYDLNKRIEQAVLGWCAHKHWPYLKFSWGDHHAVGDQCCVAERCEVYGTHRMEIP